MLGPAREPLRLLGGVTDDAVELPQVLGPGIQQQALESTKRLMNIQLEKSVMASLDYANLSEYVSFGTADFNKIVDGLIAKEK